MMRRTAISANAMEIKIHAIRRPVIAISLKAMIAAEIWITMENARIYVKDIC
jgi:hypothetical protein